MKNLMLFNYLTISLCFLLTSNLFAQELMDDGMVHQMIFSGVAEDYIIPPDTDRHQIQFYLDGGDGGKGSDCNIKGGRAAQVRVIFNISDFGAALRPGGTLRFIVGERGRNRTGTTSQGGGGGGGGTAVLYKNPGATPDGVPSTELAEADSKWVILAVAGGGGGACQRRDGFNICSASSEKGQGGRITINGGGNTFNPGGTNGNGGKSTSSSGAGGGYLTSGYDENDQSPNKFGKKGGISGGDGGYFNNDNDEVIISGKGGWGYGGGGAGFNTGTGGGGGAGGFSGGGAGRAFQGSRNGGGGGSFTNAAAIEVYIQGNERISDPKDGYINYKFRFNSGLITRCKDVTVQLDASGQHTFLPIEADDGSFTTDGSTILDYYAAPFGGGPFGFFNFDCTDLGEHEFLLVVVASGSEPKFCSFNLTVEDPIPPVAQCKNTIAVLDTSNIVNILPASVDDGSTDACSSSVLTLDNSTFSCSDIGDQIVELTIRDEDDNTATCTATVTVEDTEAPQATCNASPITLQLDDCTPQNISISQVLLDDTDNCNVASRSLGKSSFDCDDIGQNTVTVTVEDPSGNTGTCTASVMVEGNVLPVAICQNATLSLDDQGQTTLEASDVDNGSYHPSDPISLSVNPANFDCTHIGEQEVTLAATDNNENQSICTATVTVEDNMPPVALCKDLTINLGSSGAATRYRGAFNDGSYDNCGSITVLNNLFPILFDCNSIGTSIITLTVSDDNNLTNSCTAIATIVDDEPPIATCFPTTVQLNSDGVSNLNPGQVLFISNDACGIQSRTVSPAEFDCDDIGNQLVVVTVTDNNGNTNTCSTSVTVEDNEAPVVSCQSATVQLDDTGNGLLDANQVNAGEDEACTIASFTLSQSEFDCSEIGTNEVILTATDQSGNTGTCSATVTVLDETPPVAQCQDRTIDVNAIIVTFPGDPLPPVVIDDGSYDNCGDVSLSFTTEEGSPISIFDGELRFPCNYIGVNTVILTASNGNLSNTCSASLTVVDNRRPSISCETGVVVQLDNTGTATLQADDVLAFAVDFCGIQSSTLSQDQFVCDDVGVQPITVTVTDNSGNTNTCQTSVTVEDGSALTAVCQNQTISLNAEGNATASAEVVGEGSGNDCGEAVFLNLDKTDFNCDDIGENTVTLTVTNPDGNSSTCSALVVVEDNIEPTISCSDNVVIATDLGICGATYTVPLPTVTDNCDGLQLRYRFRKTSSFGHNIPIFPWSDWLTGPTIFLPNNIFYKVQWEVTDPGGNTKRCSYLIQVVDEEPPNAVCLDKTVTFYGENEIEVPGEDLWDQEATMDNCFNNVYLSDETFTAQLSCDQIGSSIPVTVTLRDHTGNTSECIANITVEGLPCGIQSDQINCNESAQAGYDPTTGTYNLSAENCYDPNYYSNSDAQSMIQQELCGDGEIIAHVDAIDGDAWAGIFMRENNDPDAKMLQLAVSNNSLAQRKLRQTTGGYAFNHLFQNQGKFWLRITRSGNQFGAFLSSDGSNWDLVLMTNIPMTNCIQAGLFVSNITPGSIATAWFDQVQIITSSGSALQTPNALYPITNDQHLMTNTQFPNPTDFQVYPNPTSGALNLDLQGFMNQPLELRIFNQHGQILLTKSYDQSHSPTEKLWLEHLQNGLYLLQVKVEEHVFSKKINVIH